jgi:hypothetical protein
MSRSTIGRYAMALALGLAFSSPLAPHAFAQQSASSDPSPASDPSQAPDPSPASDAGQQQVARTPAPLVTHSVAPIARDRNGADELIDRVYGIPLAGQEHYPD